MSEITLFHGTSSKHLPAIMKDGMAKPYLTDDEELAEYYAESATDEVGGKQVILSVTVPTDALRPDTNSYEEPLTYFRDEYADSEDEWHEMIADGVIPTPEDDKDWETALKVVWSVWADEQVSPDQVVVHRVVTAVAAEPSPGY